MHSRSPDSESANGGVVPEFKPISLNHLRSYVSTHQSEITKQYEVQLCVCENEGAVRILFGNMM